MSMTQAALWPKQNVLGKMAMRGLPPSSWWQSGSWALWTTVGISLILQSPQNPLRHECLQSYKQNWLWPLFMLEFQDPWASTGDTVLRKMLMAAWCSSTKKSVSTNTQRKTTTPCRIRYEDSCLEMKHDSIHVSMPFSQIIPPSPSPSESDYTEWSKPERKTPI